MNSEYKQMLEAFNNDELEGGCNPNMLPIINTGVREGLTADQIREDLNAHIPPRAGNRAHEIDRALSRAYLLNKKEFNLGPSKDVIPASIIALPEELPAPQENGYRPFLEALFKPNEPVMICPGINKGTKSEPDNPKREVRTQKEWIYLFDSKGGPSGLWPQTKSANAGCFIIVNPVKGGTLKDVVSPRNFLIEMDSGSKEEQLGILRKAGIPILSLTDSGNKSLHAVVRVNPVSIEYLKEMAKKIYALITTYTIDGSIIGLDTGNCSANRYTRLPGSFRGDSLQALLEINPDAEHIDTWLHRRKFEDVLSKLPMVVNAGDLADTHPPERDPVLSELFDTGDKVVLIGSSKSRKSFMAIQLALQLALGRKEEA